MRRAPEILDFAAKLGLVLDHFNWSRSHLAQRVGVDKSVAQRWATGAVMPAEVSLTTLTEVVRETVPDFTRADWRLPLERFRQRLEGKAPFPFDRAAGLFPRSCAVIAPSIDALAQRYAGFWLLLHASVQAPERPDVVGYLAGIVPRGDALWMDVEGSLQGTWRAAGPVFPLHRLLYIVLEDKVQGDSLAFSVLTGVNAGRAMILDGIGTSAASSLRGPVAATRMMGFRLADEPEPPWRGEALRRLIRQNAQGLSHRMPAPLAARFRTEPQPLPRSMVMTVTAAMSLACDSEEIGQGLSPEGASALAFARELCGV